VVTYFKGNKEDNTAF